MKPNTDYGTTITSGTMKTGSATIELTPEMFTLLSDGMYTDKILAAIRESICNARDAQVEADKDTPLEMHLPTRLEPFFHIRDFGKGLSERQVLGYTDKDGEYVPGLYLRYGKSTKRDTNLQIGGFGIGCKAPLAYSDSFVVESYQQGIVKTYTIYKENGIPNVAKLTEMGTTEPDGLKVKIAVTTVDVHTFVSKASEFLKFFNYPVNITGQRIQYDINYVLTTKLYDTVQCSYSEHGNIKASMGGVVYNVSDKYKEELEQVAKDTMLIMKFEIGDLSVAGSRENLSEDTATIAKLDAAVTKIRTEFYAVMKGEVENPRHSVYEAIEVLRKFDLIRSDWRTSRWVTTKAAEDFTIGGENVDTLLEIYSDVTPRTVRSDADSNIQLTSFREVPLVLEVDRGSGYLKVAKKLSRDSGNKSQVILADTTELPLLQEFFGKGKLTVEKASVKYAEFFPKGIATSGKVKVANSGLFNITKTDIKEIDEGQEGYYIPFERFTCIMKDKPSGFGEFTKVNAVIKGIIAAGHLKEDEIFYSRKSGMRAIKKTKLKELTWSGVEKLARKCYSKKDYKNYVYLSAKRNGNPAENKHKSLQPLWEKVKHNYSTWNDKRDIVKAEGFDRLIDSVMDEK